MVVKRSCSFCAGEIEPGTGAMFIKRDGTVFHFCSSSCRKQQLHLGRVGHRLKWTRAHAIKRLTEQSSAAGKAAGAKSKAATGRPAQKPAAPAAGKEAPAPAIPSPPKEGEKSSATEAPESSAPAIVPDAPPARKPRAKKPKEPDAST
jgi:large subunit ribosomal protein L24e